MEDIATWREYMGAGSVASDVEPNHSDGELYKNQKRLSKTGNYELLADKSRATARNFNADSVPSDFAPHCTLKVGEQQGSLPSGSVLNDTTQCSESLFPDPESY